MQKIASFTVDHIRLRTGLYLSRTDYAGKEPISTFDIRMTRPNVEPVMGTAAAHTIEHLGATYLRNDPEWKDRVIYFGPMGCRTGFYLVVAGAYSSEEILPLVDKTMRFVAAFEGEVPGASAKDCGNYLDMNLSMAKYHAQKYIAEVLDAPCAECLNYPE